MPPYHPVASFVTRHRCNDLLLSSLTHKQQKDFTHGHIQPADGRGRTAVCFCDKTLRALLICCVQKVKPRFAVSERLVERKRSSSPNHSVKSFFSRDCFPTRIELWVLHKRRLAISQMNQQRRVAPLCRRRRAGELKPRNLLPLFASRARIISWANDDKAKIGELFLPRLDDSNFVHSHHRGYHGNVGPRAHLLALILGAESSLRRSCDGKREGRLVFRNPSCPPQNIRNVEGVKFA